MTDTYEQLVVARGANMALQLLINEHRRALVDLIRQPFSRTCVEVAKRCVQKPIDVSVGEVFASEFMELWNAVHGEEP